MLTRALELAQELGPHHQATQLLRDYATLQASLYQLSQKLGNPAVDFSHTTIEAALVTFATEHLAKLQAENERLKDKVQSLEQDVLTVNNDNALLKSWQMAWQPIETCPKDGSEFQAWIQRADGRQWCEHRCTYDENESFRVWGRIDYDQDGWDWLTVECKPTHWMPQPMPPQPLPDSQQLFKRKCARCGKVFDAPTPEGVGIAYCGHSCAD